MSQNPTENLRRGRRRIEEIPEMIILMRQAESSSADTLMI